MKEKITYLVEEINGNKFKEFDHLDDAIDYAEMNIENGQIRELIYNSEDVIIKNTKLYRIEDYEYFEV